MLVSALPSRWPRIFTVLGFGSLYLLSLGWALLSIVFDRALIQILGEMKEMQIQSDAAMSNLEKGREFMSPEAFDDLSNKTLDVWIKLDAAFEKIPEAKKEISSKLLSDISLYVDELNDFESLVIFATFLFSSYVVGEFGLIIGRFFIQIPESVNHWSNSLSTAIPLDNPIIFDEYYSLKNIAQITWGFTTIIIFLPIIMIFRFIMVDYNWHLLIVFPVAIYLYYIARYVDRMLLVEFDHIVTKVKVAEMNAGFSS